MILFVQQNSLHLSFKNLDNAIFVFRCVCFFWPVFALKNGIRRLGRLIQFFQWIFTLIFVIHNWSTGFGNRYLRFCQGISEIKTTRRQIGVAMLQIFAFCRVIFYVLIYFKNKNRYDTNFGFSQADISRKRRKNVITLTGEIVEFVILTTSYFIFAIIERFQVFHAPIFTQEGVVFLSLFHNAAVSISYVISSPEMMRHYFRVNI